jgi:hypothetical protein
MAEVDEDICPVEHIERKVAGTVTGIAADSDRKSGFLE